MKPKDFYEVLGVKRDATLDEIKKSYRKLAHQYHPDVSTDPKGEEKFKDVAEAYGTLKDTGKRAAYDALRRNPSGQNFTPPHGGYQQPNGRNFSFDDVDLTDLFSGFSNANNQGRQNVIHGQDYELSTNITLEDACTGTTVDLNFEVREPDQLGKVKRMPHSFKANIPKGLVDGQKMLLRGKGGKGLGGGRDGNLYLTIHFIPHVLYRAEMHNLLIDLPLSPWEAMLGVTIKVPTLAGAVNLKIPVGARNGQKFRIAKRGMPRKNGEVGDLYAVTNIVLPTKPSEGELGLLKQWSEISDFNPRANFESEL
jgi:curved DNA-binding protein